MGCRVTLYNFFCFFFRIFARVTHPTANLPNEVYLQGLLAADKQTLEHIYTEFRPAIVRAINTDGGSNADGGVFFQTALYEAAALARSGQLHADIPFFPQLKALAVAHYRDWLEERGQYPDTAGSETAEISVGPDEESASTDEAETEETTPLAEPGLLIPASDDLRLTRHKLFAWKKLDRLDARSRGELLEWAALPPISGDPLQHSDWQSPAAERYQALLQTDPNGTGLPDWSMAALHDSEGYKLWQAAQQLEARIDAGLPIIRPTGKRDRTEWILRVLFGALLLITLGWFFFFRGKTPAKVYKDHFAPPASIVADLQLRYGPDMAFDSATARPETCTEMFRRADTFYKEKNYISAAGLLEDITAYADPLCQSDAWFYLGLVSLQLDDPGFTLACFSKIEDLERYGEDLYWFQALAFVKMAEKRPGLTSKAIRAVQRAQSNTQIPERREAAQKILDKLSN